MSDQSARDQAAASYRALLAKLDAKFQEIHSLRPEAFQCRAGCFGCCARELSVFRVEADAIASYLRERPALCDTLRQLRRAPPHGGAYCSFLGPAGQCLIYPVRPVICRSHGLPCRSTCHSKEAASELSVCPLNYEGLPLSELPAAEILDLDTLNTILVLIAAAYSGDKQGQRLALPAILDELLHENQQAFLGSGQEAPTRKE